MMSGPAHAESETGSQPHQALVIISSESLYTQGMAMILTSAMQQQGTAVHVLLCDRAGDLAVEGYTSETPIKTPPSNPAGAVKPEGIMQMLLENGATVSVCAIYLPNSDYTEADLRDGVSVAAPGDIATLMLDPSVRVFSF